MSAELTALLQRCLQAYQSGDPATAVALCRDILHRHPELAPAHHLLGLALQALGQSEAALTALDRARALAPRDVVVCVNRAGVLLALGQTARAQLDARAALSIDPRHAGAWLNLGLALQAEAQVDAAADAFRRALQTRPHELRARLGLAQCELRRGRAADALAVLQAVDGDAVEAVLLRAEACIALGQADRAESLLQALPEAERDSRAVRLRLFRSALDSGRHLAALAQLDRRIARDPDDVDARLKLAVCLLDHGDTAAALAQYRRLLAHTPDYAEARSNYLIALQHAVETDPPALLAAHVEWAERHAPREDAAAPLAGADGGERKILWVSPRFHAGPVATFFLDVLRALRRVPAGWRHVLVMTSDVRDGVTAQFRALADDWIDAVGMDDDALCARLRQERAAVAVDLSGHAPGHRLAVFARRVAPRQITWLDSFATTGIPAMDALLSDAFLTPAGSEAHFSERLRRLPRGRLCYGPPAVVPPAAPREPVLISANRYAKISPPLKEAWREILQRLPGWRLRLRAQALHSQDLREALTAWFGDGGIAPERLEFAPFGTYADVLGDYARASVALDSHPFSGCATTCDALWMGTPVVTWVGQTLVSRQSAALLHRLDLDGLIAADRASYVERVVSLAQDPARRERLHADLRDQVRARLADADAFAADLAAVLDAPWPGPADLASAR